VEARAFPVVSSHWLLKLDEEAAITGANSSVTYTNSGCSHGLVNIISLKDNRSVMRVKRPADFILRFRTDVVHLDSEWQLELPPMTAI
jgi:hypothetical protein